MKTVAVRIPEAIEKEVGRITKVEKLDKSSVLRKILEIGIEEWKKEHALKLLQHGKITLWKASEIAGLTIWEMLELIKQKNISLPIKAEDVIEDIRV